MQKPKPSAMLFVKVIYESIVQAVQQLNGNKLRSFLSSLGITIGIFCIIAVLSAVDSLENNVSESFDELGTDVLYIDKQPWDTDHGKWWKYNRRPKVDHRDLDVIQEKVKNAEHASLSVFIPGKTVKYGSSYVRGGYMAGVTYEYPSVTTLDFAKGRYFTPFEYTNAANRVILGHELASELFGVIDPIGKEVKIMGQKFQVVGVLEKEGNSLVSVFDYDEAIIIGYNTAKKLVNVRTGASWGTLLNVKAKPDVRLVDLRDEVEGVLRSHRKIRPKEENNFAINEVSMFDKMLAPIFDTMSSIGWIIGLFAIVVGIFSVANIMFVSVKERTNIIGIKKALGARNSVILLEFLIEAILLCVVGGVVGLIVVMIVLKLVSGIFNYDMFVSTGNVIIALILAVAIGIIAGLIPASQAARMDPVEAMRAK